MKKMNVNFFQNTVLKTSALLIFPMLFSLTVAAQTLNMDQVRSQIHSGMSSTELQSVRDQIVSARYEEDHRYLSGEAQPIQSDSLYQSIKKGDILLVRSPSLMGAIAAGSTQTPGQFSHLIFIVEDPATKELKTVESDQGTGVVISKLEPSSVSRWVRVGLFRYQDVAVAELAADKLLESVTGRTIKYDNRLNLQDHSSLYCTEVATLAFNLVNVSVPENLSLISFLNEKLLNKLSIHSNLMFTPQDLEVDSRFALLMEWRHTSELQNSYITEAIYGQYFNWVKQGKESLEPSFLGQVAGLGASLFTGKVAKMIGEDASENKGIPTMVKYFATLALSVRSYEQDLKSQLKKTDTSIYTVQQYKDVLKKIRADRLLRNQPVDSTFTN